MFCLLTINQRTADVPCLEALIILLWKSMLSWNWNWNRQINLLPKSEPVLEPRFVNCSGLGATRFRDRIRSVCIPICVGGRLHRPTPRSASVCVWRESGCPSSAKPSNLGQVVQHSTVWAALHLYINQNFDFLQMTSQVLYKYKRVDGVSRSYISSSIKKKEKKRKNWLPSYLSRQETLAPNGRNSHEDKKDCSVLSSYQFVSLHGI